MRITKHTKLTLIKSPPVIKKRLDVKRFLLAMALAFALFKLTGCSSLLPPPPGPEDLLMCQKEKAFLQEQLEEAEADLDACLNQIVECNE